MASAAILSGVNTEERRLGCRRERNPGTARTWARHRFGSCVQRYSRRHFPFATGLLLLVALVPFTADAALKGDVNRDGIVNVGDAALLGAFLAGNATLSAEQEAAADLAPLVSGAVSPDRLVNFADFLVLLRVIGGEVTLPPSPPAPFLAEPVNPTANPLTLSGTAEANAEVTLYVNGVARTRTTADGNGNFTFSTLGLPGGMNDLDATIAVNGVTSFPSNVIQANSAATSPACVFPVVGVKVWTAATCVLSAEFMTVQQGATLVLIPGTTLRFVGSPFKPLITVGGRLLVQGELGPSGSKVVFTSDNATVGGWSGIRAEATSSGTILENARIEFARTGFELIQGGAGDILNSEILSFQLVGIKSKGTSIIEGNFVDNSAFNPGAGKGIVAAGQGAVPANITIRSNEILEAGTGIQVDNSLGTPGDPHVFILDNFIHDNAVGIEIRNFSSPLIQDGNEITANFVGVETRFLTANAFPVVNENQIHANIFRNYNAGPEGFFPSRVLDAQRNYWGDDTFAAVDRLINDKRPPSPAILPWVDFVPFYDSNGILINTHVLGETDDSVPLLADTTYTMIGPVTVRAGATWTIPPGVTLNVDRQTTIGFEVDFKIQVLGDLHIDGTLGSPVEIRSVLTDPITNLYWEGIEVAPTSLNTHIDHATLRHAERPVVIDRTDVNLTAVTIQDFFQTAITVTQAGGQFHQLSIDGFRGGILQPGTGVDLVNAWTEITDSTIQSLFTGIHIRGGDPLVRSLVGAVVRLGNVITGNTWGLWIEGTGLDGQSPEPTITGNDIAANSAAVPNEPDPTKPQPLVCAEQPANLCTSNFVAGEAAVIDATGNWWGTTVEGTIRGTFVNGTSDAPVAVEFSNFLDNQVSLGGSPTVSPNLFSVHLTAIYSDKELARAPLRPTLVPGDSVEIHFTTALLADVTARIYREDQTGDLSASPPPTPLWSGQSLAVTPGVDTLIVWDGRTTGGDFVPDEAYIYVLDATPTGGGTTLTYDPPLDPGIEGAGCTVDPPVNPSPPPEFLCEGNIPATYNPHRNEFVKVNYDLFNLFGNFSAFRVRAFVDKNAVDEVVLLDNAPFFLGPHLVVFDGRKTDAAGTLLPDSSHSFLFETPTGLKPNFVIVKGTAPTIRGPEFEIPAPPVPNVEVKSSPYLVRHSYDQISTLAFELNQDAFVTVKILDPTGVELDTPMPRVLLSAGVIHTVEWLGTGSSPGETNAVVGAPQGTYQFTILAENALQTNLQTLYRGAIQVRR